MYLLALFVPPLAVLLAGKPFQAVVNGVLYAVAVVLFITTVHVGGAFGWPLWLLAAVHAVLVVNGHQADQRHGRVLRATQAAPPQTAGVTVRGAPAALPAVESQARTARPALAIGPGKRPKLPSL